MTKITRYKENPFLDDEVIQTKKKQVRISTLGKDNNVLFNQATGEVTGTHVVSYKKVDAKEFVKIFCANIALTFNLTSAGIKAFNVLLYTVQYRAIVKDQVDLDKYALDDFLENNQENGQVKNFSVATFRRGLAELTKSKIIAPTVKMGRYFINPHFVFNGDRVVFTTAIERQKGEQQQQLDLGDNK